MAQLNDLLVMGQTTLVGPVTGNNLSVDGSIKMHVGSKNEVNFTPQDSNQKLLYVNYLGGVSTVRICNGSGGTESLGIIEADPRNLYSYSTTDPGVNSSLATGRLFFVYE